MRLGEMKEVTNGVSRWGGRIEKLWLVKYLPTNHYQLMGHVRLADGRSNGWCVLEDSERIGDCRRAATNY